MPEFMYLMSKAVVCKYRGIDTDMIVRYGIKDPKKPSGSTIKARINSKYYYKCAKILNMISIWLGLIFLIYSLYDAYNNVKYINDNNENYFYTINNKKAV
ncbi:hypothetical protein ALNOE001_07350 [Candidatus Methanobinarius endosymbioticus]|uniref:Uncharacterized protein n=1 Tax=Candidatus Methanobinarius endosymbioticus TaxID=2006182 RepID=A0A366MDV5_9EURY|nr:hypothetical protein ALNOE001_07350 [Candidatus Methanobinarius endosymbioticus]